MKKLLCSLEVSLYTSGWLHVHNIGLSHLNFSGRGKLRKKGSTFCGLRHLLSWECGLKIFWLKIILTVQLVSWLFMQPLTNRTTVGWKLNWASKGNLKILRIIEATKVQLVWAATQSESEQTIFLKSHGTRGGTWTRTAISGHRILSPACLPIPPPGQNFWTFGQ